MHERVVTTGSTGKRDMQALRSLVSKQSLLRADAQNFNQPIRKQFRTAGFVDTLQGSAIQNVGAGCDQRSEVLFVLLVLFSALSGDPLKEAYIPSASSKYHTGCVRPSLTVR